MEEIKFRPVLLGSDVNVYGMARAFHEEYGIKSIAVSKTVLSATADTKLIDFTHEPDLENPEKFMKKLIEVKENHPDETLLLIPCSDGYVRLVVEHQDELRKYYALNCPSMDVLNKLTLKENFYDTCEKYGFFYPKTEVVTKEEKDTHVPSFGFPAIIKASNSVEYWKCSFPGKMKVFIANDEEEYRAILDAIYSSTYKDHLTVQDFIPGDDSYMRVLNCYVGSDGKVKLMALGHALLEEHTPAGIGSYVAIINMVDTELLNQFKSFLEDVGWRGFVNFDMKYDMRDGKYKLFETNPRQGRSSFFVTASGYNLAKWITDDVVFHREQPLTIADKEHLWLQVPKGIVYKYVPDEKLKAKVRQLIRDGKCTNSLFYKKDMSPKRFVRMSLNQLNHFRKYKKYYGKKGLDV